MGWLENKSGNNLWYEDQGTAGTPIVFIHGWCMSSAVWELQRKGLSDSFRIITLDLRGHGNSPQHKDGFCIKSCAEDVAALLDYLDIYHVIIAGWSLGASIAIELSLLCKERLSGLVLISGTPCFVRSSDFPYGLLQAEADGMAKKVYRNIRRALDGFFSRMLASGESDGEYVHKLLSSIPIPTTDVALEALKALVVADICGRLPMIDCPTLIMNGNHDVICLPEASKFMSQQIPGAWQVVFSGCGHVPFLTQSKEFNMTLEKFRGRVCEDVYRQKKSR